MKTSRIYEDLSLIKNRSKKIFVLVIVIFVVLVLSYWKLQILDYQKFWKKSEANRIRALILPAQRGLITDRDNTILAKNIGSFQVSFIRENCEDIEESCRKISGLLNLDMDVLKERVSRYESLPLSIPVVIKDNLTPQEVSQIEARKLEFPELMIQAEPKRHYPFKTFAAHVIGYLLELSQEELKSDKYKERRLGDLVGKTGIEKEYEEKLVGIDGEKLEVVDSLGRSMEEVARREPISGQNVKLTLDFELQKMAEELLKEREGAIVVLDPQTGDVLALASYPDFDPNKFINRFTPEEWFDLVESPEFPLENRAIRGLYSPGSLFKIVMALGGIDSQIVNERTSYICNGSIRLYNHPFNCWQEKGHGRVNLYSAIEKSCNIYFYQVGKKMGIEEISRYAKMLGFGVETGIDLSGEKTGLVPDPEWKERVRNEPWFPGETISVSIGQGPLLVTPLQMAVHTASVANRGSRIIPHLLKSEDTRLERRNPSSSIDIDATHFEKVAQGMWDAVNKKGTALTARIRDYDICGKTGSTQVISSERAAELSQEDREVKTHSWFTGFAPKDNPRVVVTIIVEHGGGGGETAAPLAKKLFELFREKHDK